jgi:hypothetical protein
MNTKKIYILAVEKYLKIFFIFMKSVEMVDKNSKSQNHDDNNSHKNNFFFNILY